MSSLLGIDLGTSSVKVVVFALDGSIRGIGSAEYPILTPSVGYAEQEPEDWWRATVVAVRQAMEKAGRPEISGIGFSGQMHGFVLIGADRRALESSHHLGGPTERRSAAGDRIHRRPGSEKDAGPHRPLDFLSRRCSGLQRHQPELLDRALTLVDAERLYPIENYRRTWDGRK